MKLRITYTAMVAWMMALWIALGFVIGTLPTMRGFLILGIFSAPICACIAFVWWLPGKRAKEDGR
jgi:hypothetical protein